MPLLSLGALPARHWRRPRLNPAGLRVVSREFRHEPLPSLADPRCARGHRPCSACAAPPAWQSSVNWCRHACAAHATHFRRRAASQLAPSRSGVFRVLHVFFAVAIASVAASRQPSPARARLRLWPPAVAVSCSGLRLARSILCRAAAVLQQALRGAPARLRRPALRAGAGPSRRTTSTSWPTRTCWRTCCTSRPGAAPSWATASCRACR